MKKILGILIVALIFFGVQTSKVVKADLVDELWKIGQEKNKKTKYELAKWGLKKINLVALKSKEIKSLFSGNVLVGDYNDNQKEGRTEETYYEDGRYEGVVSGEKQKANWSVKQGKLCYSSEGCAKVYKHKENPNIYFLKSHGIIFTKFIKIISIEEIEKQRKEKNEKERITKEKKAEEERIAKEKQAEEERIAKEKQAEEERIAKEKQAEEEIIAKEKQAKEEKIAKKKLQKNLNLIPQKSELENAQNFLRNVKNFVNVAPDEFDIIKISEFFILIKPILENIFEDKQKNDLIVFKNFTNTSSNFVDYLNAKNQMEIDEKLKEIDLIFSELELSKKTLETKLKTNPSDSNAKLTIDNIKSIEILLENPESINQLNEYNEIFKTYIASLDKEEAIIAEEKRKIDSEIDEVLLTIVELKKYLKKDLTSDLAPLIIEQVKLLEKAIEKETFKDLVSANKNANQFIYKKWVEPEEKKTEEERKKKSKEKKITTNIYNKAEDYFPSVITEEKMNKDPGKEITIKKFTVNGISAWDKFGNNMDVQDIPDNFEKNGKYMYIQQIAKDEKRNVHCRLSYDDSIKWLSWMNKKDENLLSAYSLADMGDWVESTGNADKKDNVRFKTDIGLLKDKSWPEVYVKGKVLVYIDRKVDGWSGLALKPCQFKEIELEEEKKSTKKKAKKEKTKEAEESSDVIIIPSIEKLFKEKKTELKGAKKLFYGCIYEIKYGTEDVFTGKSKIHSISIGNPEESLIFYVHLGIGDLTGNLPEFEDFYKGDEKGPKIGDCFAFITYDPVQKMVNNMYQPLGIVKIFRGEYKVDEEAVIPVLKNKITVDEFFEQEVDYGSKIIKISGKVFKTKRATNDHWFKIVLFSEKFNANTHHINAYYYSENWKNDESIKKQLLSIKRGDEITLEGLFGGPKVFLYYNGFEVFEIIN